MADGPRRPRYQDYQPPALFQAGCSLRRGYGLGPTDTPEEAHWKALLARAEVPPEERTILHIGKRPRD